MSGKRLSLNRPENEINRSSVKEFLSDVLCYDKWYCVPEDMEGVESGLCAIVLGDDRMTIEFISPLNPIRNNFIDVCYSTLRSIRIEPTVRGGGKVPSLCLSCGVAGPEIVLDDQCVKIKFEVYKLIHDNEKSSEPPQTPRLFLDSLIISEKEKEEALIDPRRLLFERVMTVRGLEFSTRFDVWIVWSCKTLQNRKWIMATSLPDNNLYELTYDGETGQFYLDEYEKVSNTIMNAVVPEDLV